MHPVLTDNLTDHAVKAQAVVDSKSARTQTSEFVLSGYRLFRNLVVLIACGLIEFPRHTAQAVLALSTADLRETFPEFYRCMDENTEEIDLDEALDDGIDFSDMLLSYVDGLPVFRVSKEIAPDSSPAGEPDADTSDEGPCDGCDECSEDASVMAQTTGAFEARRAAEVEANHASSTEAPALTQSEPQAMDNLTKNLMTGLVQLLLSLPQDQLDDLRGTGRVVEVGYRAFPNGGYFLTLDGGVMLRLTAPLSFAGFLEPKPLPQN